MKYKILVTGCGGDIGQSIGKILNESPDVEALYGCDISDENAGIFIFKNFMLGPSCKAENYLDQLKKKVQDNNINLLIPIAEPELRFYAENGINDTLAGAKLVIASAKALEIGFDKLKTANFLQLNGLPFPITKPVSEIIMPDNFPVILKSRTGSGSAKVFVVNDADEFNFLKKKHPEFIVQEFLQGENGEYTCGLFRSSAGEIRTIILKRKLTGGFSGYGEVIENDEINNLLLEIAKKIDLTGSINVQLRLTPKGPVVFEINPRFSSTVLFRHMFGFTDVLWSIEDKAGVPLSAYTAKPAGRKFYKGFNEYIS